MDKTFVSVIILCLIIVIVIKIITQRILNLHACKMRRASVVIIIQLKLFILLRLELIKKKKVILEKNIYSNVDVNRCVCVICSV